MYLLYNILLTLFFLLASPYYALHLLLTERYRAGLRQRLGFVRVPPKAGSYRVWFHGVSVGEIQTLSAMAERLAGGGVGGRVLEPVYSTTTLTGQRLARAQLPAHRPLIYFPLDFPFAVARALRRVQPDTVVLAETELWPNFLRACRRRGIRVLLVNGRVSENSFKKYRLIAPFTRLFLPWIDLFLMQNEDYARRIVALGAPADKVKVTGNMKADGQQSPSLPDPAALQDIFAGLRARPDALLLVAGSTHEPEEEALGLCLAEWKKIAPGLCVIIAPRHLQRVPAVRDMLVKQGWNCALRSQSSGWPDAGHSLDILMLDTLGELAGVYQWADMVFIGKSLQAYGGQNPLEAARLGKSIIFGPHMENFPTESQTLLAEGGAIQAASEPALKEGVARLLRDEALRRRMGRGALRAVQKLQGATQKNIDHIRELLK